MIPGQSGCEISFKDNIARKIATSYSNERLLLQMKKQQSFGLRNYDNIVVPKILGHGYNNDNAFFDMEYYNAINMIDFLETADITKIDYFLNTIINFITSLSTASSNVNTTTILLDKYDTVRIDGKFDRLIDKIPDNFIEYTECHGDLTLSNILYNGKFVIIDWLDSFIESPVMDLVKIRQDTKYGWSMMLMGVQSNRLKSICKYMDDILVNAFKEYEWTAHYKTIEVMNFLRIIPYSNKKTLSWIEEQLCKI